MSKINKLGKSTIALTIMSFLLVAVLAFGGTYAYFSTSANTKAEVTMGHIHLSDATMGNSVIMTQAFAVPNQTIIDSTSQDGTTSKKISATVDSNIAYFIRAIVTAEVEIKYSDDTETVMVDHDNSDATEKVSRKVYHDHTGAELPEDKKDTHVLCDCGDKAYDVLTVTLPDSDGWVLGTETSNTATTSSSKESYIVYKTAKQDPHAADTESTTEHTLNMKVKVNSNIGENESKHFMDAVITVTVTFQAVQADYLFVDADSNPIVAENDYATKIDELVKAWETVYPTNTGV